MKTGLLILSILFFHLSCPGQSDTLLYKNKNLSTRAYEVLSIPKLNVQNSKEIVVAVIDDGFRLSHKSLKDFIYINKGEIPDNNRDDDGNGYIDDVSGWDISDMDNEVNISKHLENEYYHGTFIASIITSLATECFGENASKRIRILPVKVLSDRASTTAIMDGYQGIKYAVSMGADIICCAWSGGNPTTEEKEIINQALNMQILIIGSAGNAYHEKVDFPSSITGVLSIAALDTLLRKKDNSNYGMEVDLALPGQHVRAAYTVADNAWFYGEGTSAAAALATGCAAILKSMAPEASLGLIIESLKSTTTPIDHLNIRYSGKLGAGLPDLGSAIKYLQNPKERNSFFNPLRPEGSFIISENHPDGVWEIHPDGAYHSINFIPEVSSKKHSKKVISFFSGDSLVYKGPVKDISMGIKIPGSHAEIKFEENKRNSIPNGLKMNYYVETIDSTSLYCSDIVYIEAKEGIITDNSNSGNYANNSNCKWQITAPENTRIYFEFSEFNTEANVDFVWLFDGIGTLPENIIAKFSGTNIPPSITSRTNKVLVWFVTDGHNTGMGWKVHFRAE